MPFLPASELLSSFRILERYFWHFFWFFAIRACKVYSISRCSLLLAERTFDGRHWQRFGVSSIPEFAAGSMCGLGGGLSVLALCVESLPGHNASCSLFVMPSWFYQLYHSYQTSLRFIMGIIVRSVNSIEVQWKRPCNETDFQFPAFLFG